MIGRPPWTLDAERALMREARIDRVLVKNAGGAASAKLVAAQELGLPVHMIDRPPPPPGPHVAGVGEAAAWVRAVLRD